MSSNDPAPPIAGLLEGTDEQGAQEQGDEPPLHAWRINNDWRAAWLRVVAKSWQDDEFKKRLLKDTAQAFAEVGFPYLKETFLEERLEVVVLDYSDKGALSVSNGKAPGRQFTFTATPNLYRKTPPRNETIPAAPAGTAKRAATGPQTSLNGWQHFHRDLRQTLILRLPPKPHTSDGALALADYEAAGRVYTMTIC